MYTVLYKNTTFVVRNTGANWEFRVTVNIDGQLERLSVVRKDRVWSVEGEFKRYGTYTSFDDAIFVACRELLNLQDTIHLAAKQLTNIKQVLNIAKESDKTRRDKIKEALIELIERL